MIPIYNGQEALQRLAQLTCPEDVADPKIQTAVSRIIQQVKSNGDTTLRDLARQFGDEPRESFLLPPAQVEAALARIPDGTREVLNTAAQNIRIYAEAVMQSIQPVRVAHGSFQVGLDWKPVEKVVCYVPGGRYPLPSTALMTAVTAQAAGAPNICITSPRLGDELILAGTLAGVKHFYQLGGAQAVAAFAFGTDSIPAADMLVGPGNAYVTEAKRQLQGVIGIDMLAGPSEVAIIADAGANPHWIALDLLAQAEHDPMARAYLLTDSEPLATQIQAKLEGILQEYEWPDYLQQDVWGAIFVLPSLEMCVQAINRIAPEHLELQVAQPEALKPQLQHYGALFMGYSTPVPYGDYMAGPNHTLPTGRTARFSGGLNPLTFLRPQSWIHATLQAQDLAQASAQFAELEGLQAHALSAQARLQVNN